MARWGVMPTIVVAGCYIAFGSIDANSGVTLAGYTASRLFRCIQVQSEMLPSDNKLVFDSLIDV